jgi:hypothetical protein
MSPLNAFTFINNKCVVVLASCKGISFFYMKFFILSGDLVLVAEVLR